jgi:protein-disulfide isomerase
MRLSPLRQDAFTAANLEDRIAEFAKESEKVDLARMNKCLAEAKAGEILLRDEKLAELYHIDAVPTVFVNGVRTLGFRSVEELQAALNAAVANSASAPAGRK